MLKSDCNFKFLELPPPWISPPLWLLWCFILLYLLPLVLYDYILCIWRLLLITSMPLPKRFFLICSSIIAALWGLKLPSCTSWELRRDPDLAVTPLLIYLMSTWAAHYTCGMFSSWMRGGTPPSSIWKRCISLIICLKFLLAPYCCF